MSITITTWNVQNFSRSDPVFADKLDFIIGTLQGLGSDVVALQEILDQNALQDLANRLEFHHFAAAPDDRGIRVAFLTREAPVLPSADRPVSAPARRRGSRRRHEWNCQSHSTVPPTRLTDCCRSRRWTDRRRHRAPEV